jgi:hypothetical protein
MTTIDHLHSLGHALQRFVFLNCVTGEVRRKGREQWQKESGLLRGRVRGWGETVKGGGGVNGIIWYKA